MKNKKYILVFITLIIILLCGCKNNKVEIKFVGVNGEIIEIQILDINSDIIYPDVPNIDGYNFIEWDSNITKATFSTIITAIYEVDTFIVKFYDYFHMLLDEQEVKYGNSAIAPQIPDEDNFLFIGWSKSFDCVKENMKIYPIYEKEICEVSFLDINGNVIEKQSIKNGEDAIAPNPPKVNMHTFIKWDIDFKNVKNDLTVKAIYQANEEYEMNDVNYWLLMLSKKYNINEILMDYDKILEFNKELFSNYDITLSVDLSKVNDFILKDDLLKHINSYSNINKYLIYNDSTNKIISDDEKQEILNNRNIENILEETKVKFGIITDFAWMRAYPTNYYADKYSMDRFQETSLNVGEGVAIYHQSLDGDWYFVQSMNYNGWVEKKYIAESSKEEMLDFLNTDDKVVVISNYTIINDKKVRMGQAFPLVNDNQMTYDILFPTRNNDGLLEIINLSINKDSNFNKGYLDYTYENLFKQGFKLLGIQYSWGDKEVDGRDCSSNTASIYSTFGFKMARNTTEQMSVPKFSDPLNGINDNIIKENYKPGTLIYTSSHVMMYIGENENGESYLLHNTNSNKAGCILQSLSSYGGYRIIYALRLQ